MKTYFIGFLCLSVLLLGASLCAAIEGEILYSDGSPASWAIISLQGESGQAPNTITDASGRFRIADSPAESLRLLISDGMQEYGSVAVPVALFDDGPVSILLQRTPAKAPSKGGAARLLTSGAYTISGIVYGGSSLLPGAPIALFDASQGTQIASTITSATGFYSFSVDNGTYKLVVSPPEGLPYVDSVVNDILIAGANVTQNVVLIDRAVTFSGTIWNPDGTPMDRVVLDVYQPDTLVTVGAMTVSASGEFSFPLSAGTYHVAGRRHGNENETYQPTYWHIAKMFDSLELASDIVADATPLVLLQGRTIDESGNPVAGVELQTILDIRENDCHYECDHRFGHTLSDASGEYAMGLVRVQTPYNISLLPPEESGYAQTMVRGVTATVNYERDFVVQSPVSLSGVVRSPHGDPVSNVAVVIRDVTSQADLGQVITEASGAFSFPLAPGTYDIRLFSDASTNIGPQTVPLPSHWYSLPFVSDLIIDSTTVMDVTPFVELSGTVTDASGSPVEGVAIRTLHKWEYWTDGSINKYLCSYSWDNAFSDASGQYVLNLLPATYEGIVFDPPKDAALASIFISDVTMPENRQMDIVLPHATYLTGTVRGPDGTPANNVYLFVRSASSDYWTRQTYILSRIITDESGEYSFQLENGSYTIDGWHNYTTRIKAPVYWWMEPLRTDIEVSGDTTQDIELPFATISGKTTDSNGVPVGGVGLESGMHLFIDGNRHRQFSNPAARIISDASGDFSFAVITGPHNETIIPPQGSGFAQTIVNDIETTQDMLQNVILTFIDDKDPLILTGPYVTNVRHRSALVSWLTNEPASSGVRYGVDSPPASVTSEAGYRISHAVPLTGLTPDTLYYVQVFSSDRSGNGPVESRIVTFRTLPVADTDPPLILEGPVITCITHNSAFVEWTTNEPADSHAYYGLTTALGNVASASGYAVCHRVPLTGLTSDTWYYVRVSSTDAFGNGPVLSDYVGFRTLPVPDTDPPLIITGPMAIDITATAATIVWWTNEPATSGVSYNDGTAYGVVSDSALVTEHSFRLTGLTPSTLYFYTVSSKDAQGNGPTLSQECIFTTLDLPDTDPPLILEGPYVVNINHQLGLIRWVTNEQSDSVIEYGTTPDLGSVESRTGLVTNHSIPLTGLEPDTLYYFRVSSTDPAGNTITSGVFTFRTDDKPDTTSPVFLAGPTVLKKTDTTVTLWWITDEAADTVVDYGVAPETNLRYSQMGKSRKHRVTIVGLEPGLTYLFVCSSRDMSGNVTVATDEGSEEGAGKIQKPGVSLASSVTTDLLPDTTAPAISGGPTCVALTDCTAVVYWETDEIADTRVSYGLQGGPLTLFSGELEFTSEHQATLTNLQPSTAYSFQVSSMDVSGNGPTASSIIDFTTADTADSAPPAFVSTPTSSMDANGYVTVSWETDEISSTEMNYGPAPDDMPWIANADGRDTNHSVTLTSLEEGITYYYETHSTDGAGNTLTSAVLTLSTSTPVEHWELY